MIFFFRFYAQRKKKIIGDWPKIQSIINALQAKVHCQSCITRNICFFTTLGEWEYVFKGRILNFRFLIQSLSHQYEFLFLKILNVNSLLFVFLQLQKLLCFIGFLFIFKTLQCICANVRHCIVLASFADSSLFLLKYQTVQYPMLYSGVNLVMHRV